MNLEAVIPAWGTMSALEFAGRLRGERRERAPFAPELMDFFGGYSRAIFQHREAARFPELAALAYWMRPAELERLRKEFLASVPRDTVVVPRGIVFHIPPGNVDTIFVYSLVLACLMGNISIVRVSSRPSRQTDILVELLAAHMGVSKQLEGLVSVVRYGHDADVTAALTSICDCRVIWGGDHTVQTIRAAPLPPHAVELAFPDRHSFAVIDAPAYLALGDAGRKTAASDFFNDAFWFDQMACSSPRLVVWCGTQREADQAASHFWNSLDAELTRRGFVAQPAVSVQRLLFACETAADGRVSCHAHGPRYTRLRVAGLDSYSREHCGGGVFFETVVDDLERLVPFVTRRDQTISYLGFGEPRLRHFARSLLARGGERIVPFGQALKFGRYWDGFDLLLAFGRHIHLPSPAASS